MGNPVTGPTRRWPGDLDWAGTHTPAPPVDAISDRVPLSPGPRSGIAGIPAAAPADGQKNGSQAGRALPGPSWSGLDLAGDEGLI